MNTCWLAWLAGIVEGEGNINVHTTHKVRGGERRAYPYPQLRVRMTDEDVVRRCAEVAQEYGGGVYGPWSSKQEGKLHHKPSWQFTITGEPARRLLLDLLPYLGERRSAKVREVLSLEVAA